MITKILNFHVESWKQCFGIAAKPKSRRINKAHEGNGLGCSTGAERLTLTAILLLVFPY